MERSKIIYPQTGDLKNIFTAYLLRAVRRRRNEYIRRLAVQQQAEKLTDEVLPDIGYGDETVWIETLSFYTQIEDETLSSALKALTKRERRIFLSHTLRGLSFGDLARKQGISYKGIAATYYHALHKIRRKMEVRNV